ncbi:MAG: phosphoribosylformimino-5-aminoimidazole carboxamide ribotide isomerase [Gaiellaceae bacterium]|nr:phosphoribosylformimino-5-aminoimidazole carboxamide ribotide isomerase [Gaiellaceae bacterium]
METTRWFEQPMEVIPAVDVLGKGAVRLEQGDYDAVVERAGEPVALARRWVDAGARRIHLVDLDGARTGRVRPELVRAVAASGVPVQASGGIRSLADARALLDAGADRVVVGTAAWPDPAPWFELGDALVLALDVRDGEVRAAGWTLGTGIRYEEALVRAAGNRILVTAIERDGTLAGPDIDLVRAAVDAGGRVLAAGGIRDTDDVEALAAAGAEAAVVGRALLSG